MAVHFQRFDEEWEEYIDLDVDATINDKDNLKVVVSSFALKTPPLKKQVRYVYKYRIYVLHMAPYPIFILFLLDLQLAERQVISGLILHAEEVRHGHMTSQKDYESH